MGIGYRICGMQGGRRNMEDTHIAMPDFDEGIGLFAVFDGHGGTGVSKFAAQELPALIKGRQDHSPLHKSADGGFLGADLKVLVWYRQCRTNRQQAIVEGKGPTRAQGKCTTRAQGKLLTMGRTCDCRQRSCASNMVATHSCLQSCVRPIHVHNN